MCAPCERVRRGSGAATLVRHNGKTGFSDASVLMQLRQHEFAEPVPSLFSARSTFLWFDPARAEACRTET